MPYETESPTTSSDSEGGGARLSVSNSASLEEHTKSSSAPSNEGGYVEADPSMDSMMLMQASADFARHQAGFGGRPPIAQSVAPMTDVFGSGYPSHRHHAMARNNGGHHHNEGGRPGSRYRGSISSNASGPLDVGRVQELIQNIHGNLLTAQQLIARSQGVPSNTAREHENILRSTSQAITKFVSELTKSRDWEVQNAQRNAAASTAAIRDRSSPYDDFEAKQLRGQLSRLQHETSMNVTKMDMLESENGDLRADLERVRRDLSHLERTAREFQQHHHTIVGQYRDQDDEHFREMQQLQATVRSLRLRNEQLLSSNNNNRNSQATALDSSSSSQALVKLTPGRQSRPVILEDDEDMDEDGSGDPTPRQHQQQQTTHFNPQAPAWAPLPAPENDNEVSGVGSPSMMSSASKQLSRFVVGSGSGSAIPAHLHTHTGETPERPPRYGATPFQSSSSFSVNSPIGGGGGGMLMAPRAAAPPARHDTTSSSKKSSEFTNMPPEDMVWGEDQVRDAVQHTYELVKGMIMKCHRDDPLVPDAQLPRQEPETFNFMVELVFPNRQQGVSHLQYILGVPHYRPYLVQRMILDYLFKKMMGPSLFLGFSAEMDSHLAALQGKISAMAVGGGGAPQPPPNPRTPAGRERQRIIEQHAALVRHIIQHPSSPSFRRHVVSRHTEMLVRILSPLRKRDVDSGTATAIARIVCGAAWTIAAKVWTSAMTLHYVFPDCGAKFAYGSMLAVNAREVQGGGSAGGNGGRNGGDEDGNNGAGQEQLQYNQYRVLLVVTPTLTLRDDREASRLRTCGIRKSEVLVMK